VEEANAKRSMSRKQGYVRFMEEDWKKKVAYIQRTVDQAGFDSNSTECQ